MNKNIEHIGDPTYIKVDMSKLTQNNQNILYQPLLNMDVINTVEDCKKVLNVLFKATFKPISINCTYGVLTQISEYLK